VSLNHEVHEDHEGRESNKVLLRDLYSRSQCASRNNTRSRGRPTEDGRSERGVSVESRKSIVAIHRSEFVTRDP
jgi:hypothetical protein